ncbi:MAG: DNA polymerase domain-containing protein [Candidatus Bathyarchaeia archaeon]
MTELYLVGASLTEANSVKLKFADANGAIKEVTDDSYKPYFLTSHPLTSEEEDIIKYFSGKAQLVEKTDLFTGEKRVLNKIFWPNIKVAEKASASFRQLWESHIDFLKSYAYDKGLAYGALHSAETLKPILDMRPPLEEKFEAAFKEVQSVDPLKYAQIKYWFALLSQPVPETSAAVFEEKTVDAESAYSAWILSRITNMPLAESQSSRRVSDWLKSIIHAYLRRNNVLIPTAEELTRGLPTHRVAGALTVAPKAGIYFNTVVCDFESLYPSCIDSFNLSYETVNCNHAECASNKIPDFDGHVCTKRRGFYAVLIGALKELRIKIFKPASRDVSLSEVERKQASAVAKLLKLISVSSYGVTVRIRGLACPPLAEAITGYGRYVLKESWQMSEKRGMRPLYGDTDSLFLDNPSEEEVGWLIKAVKERFWLDLAVDKRYSLCVLPKAKKAYFGILADGTADIKGVTPSKSNAPPYINKVFQQCVKELSTVKNMQEYEEAAAKIKQTVRQAVGELRNGKVELQDLAYTVRLYFDPNEKLQEVKSLHQPYQCAQQLIDAGRKLERWTTVSFIKVKPFRYREKTFTVKPAEFVRSLSEVNVDDYVRNLLTALNQTFEPMGIKLETAKDATIAQWLTR